jgi:predicted SprT family Zn-dependent metalloprotease
MIYHDLASALQKAGIREDAYSLECGTPNESLVLCREGQQWQVYYSERGIKTGLKYFDSEEDAVDYFYQTLVHDPTTRI